MFPNFKKRISDFLSQEDGKITKQSALALGTFMIGTIATSIKDVSAIVSHTNSFGSYDLNPNTRVLTIFHTHHGSHSTHSSHGSHSSY